MWITHDFILIGKNRIFTANKHRVVRIECIVDTRQTEQVCCTKPQARRRQFGPGLLVKQRNIRICFGTRY